MVQSLAWSAVGGHESEARTTLYGDREGRYHYFSDKVLVEGLWDGVGGLRKI